MSHPEEQVAILADRRSSAQSLELHHCEQRYQELVGLAKVYPVARRFRRQPASTMSMKRAEVLPRLPDTKVDRHIGFLARPSPPGQSPVGGVMLSGQPRKIEVPSGLSTG